MHTKWDEKWKCNRLSLSENRHPKAVNCVFFHICRHAAVTRPQHSYIYFRGIFVPNRDYIWFYNIFPSDKSFVYLWPVVVAWHKREPSEGAEWGSKQQRQPELIVAESPFSQSKMKYGVFFFSSNVIKSSYI